MENKRHKFKELLESTTIPETFSYEERDVLLRPLLEYTHSIIPSKLFRYRECSERQFDAFYHDKIYAVNANLFNDPYDCLLYYDKNFLYDSINKGFSIENIKQLRDSLRRGEPFPELIASLYGKERTKIFKERILNATDEYIDKSESNFDINKNDFFDTIEVIFKKAEVYLRNHTFIACFSETVNSITMWSHYADSHKGFALEYNFKNINIKCDICCKKHNCNDRIIHNLYPIIYDNKRYDATAFIDCYLGKDLGLSAKMRDLLFFNKAALYKAIEWNREKEWRLFLNKKDSYGLTNLNVEIQPTAIYYGNDISPINKKILSDIAKEKGLKEFQMYIDNQSTGYSMKYKNCNIDF